jgi:hypothetical protein
MQRRVQWFKIWASTLLNMNTKFPRTLSLRLVLQCLASTPTAGALAVNVLGRSRERVTSKTKSCFLTDKPLIFVSQDSNSGPYHGVFPMHLAHVGAQGVLGDPGSTRLRYFKIVALYWVPGE